MTFKSRTYHRVVLLQNDAGVTAPLETLTTLVTQAIAVKHKDPLLVMHLVPAPPTGEPNWSDPKKKLHGVDHVWVIAPTGPSAAGLVAAAIAMRKGSYAAIYLVPHAGGPTLPELENVIKLLVWVVKDRKKDFAPSDKYSILLTELIEDMPKAPQAASNTAEKWEIFKQQRLADILNITDKSPPGFEVPTGPVQPERIRMRLDMDALGGLVDPDYTTLQHDDRLRIERWARALTNRRVGVALGGSGAWSYGHVTFINGLLGQDIPIDMVSGSSGGAFVGAYYAAKGPIGLTLYVSRSTTLQLLVVPAIFTMAVIEWLFDYDLGDVNVNDLEIPIYAVTTNLTTGQENVILDASVGWAARASASAPGLFASTIIGKTIFVDGAVSDSVPATVVADMGAALVIGSNPMPAPNSRPIFWQPNTVIGKFFQQLNPLGRLFDTLASGSLLFHDSGDYQARAAGAQVIYDPTPRWFPILKAFLFVAAPDVIESTLNDPKYDLALVEAKKAWDDLSAPMLPPSPTSP